MITGKLKDIARYKGLHKNLDTAIDYVLNNDLLALEKGKYEIDGDNVYLNRDTYVAKDESECFFETHNNYLDLQIVLSGKEYFGYTDITDAGLVVTDAYNPTKDVTKYKVDALNRCLVVLENGGFAIVFPEDAHLPKLKINDEKVEKVVIKIKL